MHPFHPFWSLEVPRVDGQLLLTPCPGTQQVPLILALDRRVPDSVAELRAGRWNKKAFSQARGLFGRTKK